MKSLEDVDIDGVDIETLREVLEESPITLGVLYGSVARGTDHERSDIDVAVEFDEDLSSTDRTDARLSLIERLAIALGTDDVDVVPIARVPHSLLDEIRTDGVILIGSESDLERHVGSRTRDSGEEDPTASFDDILDDIERVV